MSVSDDSIISALRVSSKLQSEATLSVISRNFQFLTSRTCTRPPLNWSDFRFSLIASDSFLRRKIDDFLQLFVRASYFIHFSLLFHVLVWSVFVSYLLISISLCYRMEKLMTESWTVSILIIYKHTGSSFIFILNFFF